MLIKYTFLNKLQLANQRTIFDKVNLILWVKLTMEVKKTTLAPDK